MNNLKVKLKKLDDRAVIPTYAHNGDVGMDMTAIDVEYDANHDMYIYHTGLAFESDMNVGQFLFPRSSNRKTDAYLCNSVGIADSAIYRGEILFCYKNRTSREVKNMLMVINTIAAYINSFASEDENNKTNNFNSQEVLQMAVQMISNHNKTINEHTNPLDDAPYKVGDRIGQMVFLEYPTVEIEVVDELSDSTRGANGFGSTGS